MFSALFSRLGSMLVISTALVSTAAAQVVVLDAYDQGWYDSDGFHEVAPPNTNYFVGSVGDGRLFRNFFAFDRSSLTNALVNGATLEVFNPEAGIFGFGGYVSSDSAETISLYSFDGSLAALSAGTGGVGAFGDLGSGTLFGSADVSAADNGQWVTFTLNSNFISYINGLTGQFAFGGDLSTHSGDANQAEYVFGESYEPFARLTLQYTAVPEPSTYGLIGAGLLGLVVWRRRATRGAVKA